MQGWESFLPLVAIVVLFWFLMIRPARKRQQQMVSTQNSVQPGNQVMLGSGIYGTVVSVADDTLQLEVSPGTAVKVARQAVVKVVEHDFATGASSTDTETGADPDTGSTRPVIDEQ